MAVSFSLSFSGLPSNGSRDYWSTAITTYLKKQVILGRFTFSPHVKTQDVSVFGERECQGNSWSFLGRAAFSPPQVKMLRPGQKRMRKHSGCPAENFIFFFKLTIYKHCSEKKKKKTFVGPSSSSESLMNDVSKNPSRDALLHKYCVAVWKEGSGAVGGEARRARAGERILIWAARSLLKKLILKEAQRKYPFTEDVTGERRSHCEPGSMFREEGVCSANSKSFKAGWQMR